MVKLSSQDMPGVNIYHDEFGPLQELKTINCNIAIKGNIPYCNYF